MEAIFGPPGCHMIERIQAHAFDGWLPSVGRKVPTPTRFPLLSVRMRGQRDSAFRDSLCVINLGPKGNTLIRITSVTVIFHRHPVSTLHYIDGLHLLSACCIPGASLSTVCISTGFFNCRKMDTT